MDSLDMLPDSQRVSGEAEEGGSRSRWTAPRSTHKTFASSLMPGVGDEVLVTGALVALLGVLALVRCARSGRLWRTRPPATQDEQQHHGEIPGRVREGGVGGDGAGGGGVDADGNADRCGICLEDDPPLALETNCGHLYCPDCFFEFFRRVDAGLLGPPSCPYCRQRITLLLPYFTQAERQSVDPGEVQRRTEVLGLVRQFNRRFSGEPRTVLEQINDVPVLLRHLWRQLWDGEGLDLFFRARMIFLMVLAACYVLLPFDILPEAVFGVLGFVDDLLFLLLMAVMATAWFRQIFGAAAG